MFEVVGWEENVILEERVLGFMSFMPSRVSFAVSETCSWYFSFFSPQEVRISTGHHINLACEQAARLSTVAAAFCTPFGISTYTNQPVFDHKTDISS